jgi:hypothetical protein
VQSITVRNNGVVDLEILKNLNDCKRCARQDALEVMGTIEIALIVIEVLDINRTEAFHVFLVRH